jgi:DNA-binding GntR family transcriptional regulator
VATSPRPLGTAQQYALEWLRRAIVARELRPGERIGQDDLAEQIGVSVVPVREALRVLEAEGQVTYRPRRGYFVTELRFEELVEIYELRQVLEERAARRAVPIVDAITIARMAEADREWQAAAAIGAVAQELDANRRFHFTLLEAADQPILLRLIRVLWDSTEAYRALYYNLPHERKAVQKAHAGIMRAVRARDTERTIRELDAHRARALETLSGILG